MQKPNFEGHLDHCGDGRVFGWVRDLDDENARLWVEIILSSGWSTQVRADSVRQDLVDEGIGDGAYGFEVAVPFEKSGSEGVRVDVKVAGSDFILSKSGRHMSPEYPVHLVAGDIVDNCNLRCPFCVTDYDKVRGSRRMPEATFRKSLELLELVPEGMFWLSCMHEATMHPQLLDLLEMVPLRFRRKISFTTNLCRRMDDVYLRRLAESNVQAFRISIDSLDEDLFAELRKGGRLSVFLDNLRRLADCLECTHSKTEVHFVTMAFKSNAQEILDLVRFCRSIVEPARHEIRFMFYVPHASEWGESRILETTEWVDLKESASNDASLGPIEFYDPEEGVHEKFREKPGLENYESPVAVFGGAATPSNYKPVDPLVNGTSISDEPLRFRLRWDGLMMMETLPEDQFRQNILDIDRDYIIRLRESARAGEVEWLRTQS